MPGVDALTEPDTVGIMDPSQWSVHVAPASTYCDPTSMVTVSAPLSVSTGSVVSCMITVLVADDSLSALSMQE